jgi:hypothetical protein
MLVGDPTASQIYFNLDLTSHPEGIFGMLPSDTEGLLPPPAGAPNIFAYFTADESGDPKDGLRLFDFHTRKRNLFDAPGSGYLHGERFHRESPLQSGRSIHCHNH